MTTRIHSRSLLPTLVTILLMLMALCAVVPETAACEATEMETMLVDAINGARTSGSTGSQADAVLDPLVIQENLCRSAKAHTEDMLTNDYVGKIDSQGRSLEQRLVDDGYSALVIDEAVGVVVFKNFMEPVRAIDILFSKMFDADTPLFAKAALTHVGVGIQSGTLTLDGTTYNAYLATCDFSSPPDSPLTDYAMAEATLVHLINQLRMQPMAVMADAGIDVDFFLKKQPLLADSLMRRKLEALAPNDRLFTAARLHTEEMAAFQYIDHTSNNGQSTEERLTAAGYQALVFSESIEMVIAPEQSDLETVVQLVFERLLATATESDFPDESAILDPAATDIGIGLRGLTPKTNSNGKTIYIVTIDVATPTAVNETHLLGMVYDDANGNALFDAGEHLAGFPVFVDYPHQLINVATDAVGGIDLPLGPADTRVVIWPGLLDDEFWVILEAGNKWFSRSVDTSLVQ